MSIHTSYGKIKYDPHSERTTFKPWWIILQCDKEIVRYYQHIFQKLYWKKLQTAIWSSHISIVRGEKPVITDAWKKFDGKIIEFNYKYEGSFCTNSDNGGKHFWLKAFSNEFSDIRKSLGLNVNCKIPYHISIGSLGS